MGMPRRIVTYYNGGERASHSVTMKAAARAAFSRLIVGDYRKAVIYDMFMHQTIVMVRTATGIRTTVYDWSKLL